MHIRDLVHGVGQALVLGRDGLAAVLVVYLDAIIVGRIMRGGNINPAQCAQFADDERQFGGA